MDDAIAGCKIVVCVLGSSMVSSNIKDTNSFVVDLSQSALWYEEARNVSV